MRPADPLTWVIGSGGLLGSNVVSAASGRVDMWRPVAPIPWGTIEQGPAMRAAAYSFGEAVGHRPWQILWCAGAAITGSTDDQLLAERNHLAAFLADVGEAMSPEAAARGGLFMASSAGGVYAGSSDPPYDEHTPIRPISPYGRAKQAMEEVATAFGRERGVDVAVGRISNLYGPGQNLGKPQGLLSQIIRAMLIRQPISIYTSLDTIRDYIFVTDCAGLVLDSMDRVRRGSGAGQVTTTKILAAQQGTTISAVISELRRIFKRPAEVVYVASSNTKFQARDLRFRSVTLSDLDRRQLTPLPVGLSATVQELTRRLQSGQL